MPREEYLRLQEMESRFGRFLEYVAYVEDIRRAREEVMSSECVSRIPGFTLRKARLLGLIFAATYFSGRWSVPSRKMRGRQNRKWQAAGGLLPRAANGNVTMLHEVADITLHISPGQRSSNLR